VVARREGGRRRPGREHAPPDLEPGSVPAAPGPPDALLQSGTEPARVVGDGDHVDRRRPDVERGAAPAGGDPRPNQEQAGAARGRHDRRRLEHGGGELGRVAGPRRAVSRWRPDMGARDGGRRRLQRDPAGHPASRGRAPAAALSQQGDARADELVVGRRPQVECAGDVRTLCGQFGERRGDAEGRAPPARLQLPRPAGGGAGQLSPRDARGDRRGAERGAGALAACGVVVTRRGGLDAGDHPGRCAQPARLRLPGHHPDARRRGPGGGARPAAAAGRSSGKRGSEPALLASAHTLPYTRNRLSRVTTRMAI
jgi:hypothetical protein